MILHCGKTSIGCVRKTNQDSFRVYPDENIYVLSDGIGGKSGGEVASRIVVEVLFQLLKEKIPCDGRLDPDFAAEAMTAAVQQLSESVCQKARDTQFDGMGATLAVAVVRPPDVLVSNLGDSRIYLFRDGQLQQLSVDHSMAQLLADVGESSQSGAGDEHFKSTIVQYVGMDGAAKPENKIIQMQPNDRILLCSDGLTSMVPDRQITEAFQQADSLEHLCASLVDRANEQGGHDNITVLVLENMAQDPTADTTKEWE